jgi:hypothetical protein
LIGGLLRGGETAGVIGERARDQLKVLPSTAYWTGLRAIGLRLFPGTQEQYHHSIDGYVQLQRGLPHLPKGEDPALSLQRNWHPSLDDLEREARGFLDDTTFELAPAEGDLIGDLIRRHTSDSMLAQLCAVRAPSSVQYPWLHPRRGELTAKVREQLVLAEKFSDVMHGASLLYNLLLARRRGFDELAAELVNSIDGWAVPAIGHAGVDWDEFWLVVIDGNPRVRPATQRFIERWFAMAGELGAGVASDAAAARLIEQRERQAKFGQARLSNPRRLETWTDPVGLRQLDYRWGVVQTIVNDVVKAVRRGERARG